MLPSIYQAMLLLLVMMLARQSVAESQSILRNSDSVGLRVITDPLRAAVIVSRTVTATPAKPAASDTTSPTEASNTTSAMMPERTTPKLQSTGEIELAFGGLLELDANSSAVGPTSVEQFHSGSLVKCCV